ncbi:hypothetical protein AB4Y85_15980 [Microvirga sp. 2YAF29]|uniref:hypothetical protein n=1 Tax=Microvirga sp. 2YAF29 TaxID=3233031 RepID=UPI003F9D0191
MKARSRKSLAAALSLGAAVFALPVQALQCLEPTYIKPDSSIDAALARMRNNAAALVGGAKSIFRGHVVSAEVLSADSPYEARFLVTYKVSEWKKGDGQSNANVIYLPWCDGECEPRQTIENLLSHKEERIFFASSGEEEIKGSVIDGYLGPCHLELSKRPINAQNPRPPFREYFGQFLYELAIAAELEKLPSRRP